MVRLFCWRRGVENLCGILQCPHLGTDLDPSIPCSLLVLLSVSELQERTLAPSLPHSPGRLLTMIHKLRATMCSFRQGSAINHWNLEHSRPRKQRSRKEKGKRARKQNKKTKSFRCFCKTFGYHSSNIALLGSCPIQISNVGMCASSW